MQKQYIKNVLLLLLYPLATCSVYSSDSAGERDSSVDVPYHQALSEAMMPVDRSTLTLMIDIDNSEPGVMKSNVMYRGADGQNQILLSVREESEPDGQYVTRTCIAGRSPCQTVNAMSFQAFSNQGKRNFRGRLSGLSSNTVFFPPWMNEPLVVESGSQKAESYGYNDHSSFTLNDVENNTYAIEFGLCLPLWFMMKEEVSDTRFFMMIEPSGNWFDRMSYLYLRGAFGRSYRGMNRV